MRILVACKRVVDYAVRVRPTPDGRGVDVANVRHSLNPFDEIAVEAALRIKEERKDVEVIAVTVGGAPSAEQLKTALAMGADRGVHVLWEKAEGAHSASPRAIATVLHAIALKLRPSLVLLGKQAIDEDGGQVGPMLAGLLDWPLATFASKIALCGESVEVEREVDEGRETVRCKLPAVITADLRLNTPRYATLPNIIKAKSKPVAGETLESLGVSAKDELKLVRVEEPPRRKAGVLLKSVDELVEKLRQENLIS